MEELIDDNQSDGLRFYYNLKTLKNITLIAVSLAILLLLFRIFAIINFQSLYHIIKTDYSASSKLMWYGNLIDQLSILVLFFSIISWIPFFMWLYRAYYNLDIVKLRGLNVVPGWAVGWFFIPFANLYYSVIVINDLFRGTHHIEKGGSVKQGFENSPTVPWGILWLITRVMAGLLSYMGLYRVIRGNIAVFDSACTYEIVSNLLNIASGIVILFLVIWVTKKQMAIMNAEIKQ